MRNSKIAIFSSCAGYGTYTPALALKKDMSSIGIDSQIFVFETFFEEEQKNQFLTYRNQFHDSFRFATMASGIASKTLHDAKISFLSRQDMESKRFDKYIVLYGLWLPVLLRLGIAVEQIVCLQLDVEDSPSWGAVKEMSAECENIWAIGKDGNAPNYKFQDVDLKDKSRSLVIHGGGWGITNYVDVLNKIQNEYDIHVIFSSLSECSSKFHSYYTPLNWLPDKDNPDYPPLNRYPENEKTDFCQLCLNSSAIISKPGGGTCLDSLRLHTPLIYLKGMAKHEEKNAEHFKELGYACSFEEWESTGFSSEKIEHMRKKIATDMARAELLIYHLK